MFNTCIYIRHIISLRVGGPTFKRICTMCWRSQVQPSRFFLSFMLVTTEKQSVYLQLEQTCHYFDTFFIVNLYSRLIYILQILELLWQDCHFTNTHLKSSSNLTVAAEWKVIWTSSWSISQSLSDNPRFSSAMSPVTGTILLLQSPPISRTLSKICQMNESDSQTGLALIKNQ